MSNVELPNRQRRRFRTSVLLARFRTIGAGLVLLLALGVPGAPVVAQGVTTPGDEVALIGALDDARAGRAEAALQRLEALVERNPNFRLAQLVYADLLLARSGRVGGFGAAVSDSGERLEDLRAEALARLSHYRSQPALDRLPAPLLQLAPSQRRLVLVDQARSRLYLFENVRGQPRLVGDYYVSTGKKGARKEREGDQRTPVGVYFITTRLGSEELDDFYGAGALPVNYPNEWDERYGRTGYGIWIHGVPSDTYSRPPRASDGCMALPNGDLEPMLSSLDIGTTPVVIADRVEWISAEALARRRDGLRSAIDRWRRDWESLDTARYARHYAADFATARMDRAAWMPHKRQVNSNKRFVRVGIDDLSLYAYPGERELVMVSFTQDYRSDTFTERSTKRQYWRRGSDGEWRIVFEGEAAFRAEHFRGIPWSARSRLSRLVR